MKTFQFFSKARRRITALCVALTIGTLATPQMAAADVYELTGCVEWTAASGCIVQIHCSYNTNLPRILNFCTYTHRDGHSWVVSLAAMD
jgi:hypothetical protein